jgi:hypothetical protein
MEGRFVAFGKDSFMNRLVDSVARGYKENKRPFLLDRTVPPAW